MEIHTCKNCEIIDEVVSKKIGWYELLSAENSSLHSALLSARQQIAVLLRRIANLRSISMNDQDEIVKLFFETETQKCSESINTRDGDDVKKIMSLIDYQKKIHEEQMNILLNEKEIWLKESERQHNKLQDHVSVLLQELDLCRKQLLKRQKENAVEKQLFRDVIVDVKSESAKALERISKENMYVTYDKAKSKVEIALRTKNEQLKRQDDLINILRYQQDALNSQIENVVKNKDVLIQQFKNKINRLKDDLKKNQHKYYDLERRRRLEAEGFLTDVRLLRKELKGHSKTCVIDGKLTKLEHKIVSSYSN